jgi:hypothetical protein
MQAATGFFYPCIHIGINTLILRNTEAAFMGRVGGIMGPMFMGFMVIGMSVAGYLKGAFSLFTVFTGSGVLLLTGMLVLLLLVRRQEPGRESLRG